MHSQRTPIIIILARLGLDVYEKELYYLYIDLAATDRNIFFVVI